MDCANIKKGRLEAASFAWAIMARTGPSGARTFLSLGETFCPPGARTFFSKKVLELQKTFYIKKFYWKQGCSESGEEGLQIGGAAKGARALGRFLVLELNLCRAFPAAAQRPGQKGNASGGQEPFREKVLGTPKALTK